jgi:hypothetical protein
MSNYKDARTAKFRMMIGCARKYGKAEPTMEEIEGMVPDDLVCICGRQMLMFAGRWTRAETMTLQHWDDGSMSIVCQSCNSTHSRLGDDIFFCTPAGACWCAECQEYKPESLFGNYAGRSKPKCTCFDCTAEKARGYRAMKKRL